MFNKIYPAQTLQHSVRPVDVLPSFTVLPRGFTAWLLNSSLFLTAKCLKACQNVLRVLLRKCHNSFLFNEIHMLVRGGMSKHLNRLLFRFHTEVIWKGPPWLTLSSLTALHIKVNLTSEGPRGKEAKENIWKSQTWSGSCSSLPLFPSLSHGRWRFLHS